MLACSLGGSAGRLRARWSNDGHALVARKDVDVDVVRN
jgi:hypothetical protein